MTKFVPGAERSGEDSAAAFDRERQGTERREPVRLEPPPRILPVAPPRRGSESAPRRRSSPEGGLGWKTVTAFAGLSLLAIGVVFLLPDWVAERSPGPEGEPAPIAPAAATEVKASSDLKALAAQKTEAEQALAEARRLRETLAGRSVDRWAAEDFKEALESIPRGDERMELRDYDAALRHYEAAAQKLERILDRAGDAVEDAVARGRRALASGRSAEARDAFELALAIQPKHAEAYRGLERAESLDEVLALVASGEEHERRGDLEGARKRYREAVSLDPRSETAQGALARVDARASELSFTRAMSEGVAALTSHDYQAALTAFEKARAIRPGAAEAADGIAQAEEGLRLETIARLREEVSGFEAEERWREAEAGYRRALEIDPSLRFAQRGLARARKRAELSERLAFHLGRPERLSDENVLEEVSRLVDAASAVEPAGPKLRKQVEGLEALLARYRKPVVVELVSDGETEVTVYRVGRLGKFERRALELRPGTYTVVGSRPGYRDVRRELVVPADAPPEPLEVQCEERI